MSQFAGSIRKVQAEHRLLSMVHHPYTEIGSRNDNNYPSRNVKPKCLQVNLQHSRVAASNLTQIIIQHNIDVAFVQEQYTLRDSVAGFPKSFKIHTQVGGRKRVAITVNNNEVDVIAITQGSHEDAILTKIRHKGLRVYGASIYFPIDKDTERALDTLDNILQYIKGEGLVLAIDSGCVYVWVL